MQLKIEREALKKENDAASKDRLTKLVKELEELEQESAELTAEWQAEKGKLAGGAEAQGTARPGPRRAGAGAAPRRLEPRRRTDLWRHSGTRAQARRGRGRRQRTHARRSGDRPSTSPAIVSRWTGIPVDKMLEGEREKLLPHGGKSAPPRHRSGRGGGRRVERDPPRPRRVAGPEPADRLVPVPRADRRRQDRADQGARRVPVRRRERDGAHRHVGIHGEALRLAADRRAAGLCRL